MCVCTCLQFEQVEFATADDFSSAGAARAFAEAVADSLPGYATADGVSVSAVVDSPPCALRADASSDRRLRAGAGTAAPSARESGVAEAAKGRDAARAATRGAAREATREARQGSGNGQGSGGREKSRRPSAEPSAVPSALPTAAPSGLPTEAPSAPTRQSSGGGDNKKEEDDDDQEQQEGDAPSPAAHGQARHRKKQQQDQQQEQAARRRRWLLAASTAAANDQQPPPSRSPTATALPTPLPTAPGAVLGCGDVARGSTADGPPLWRDDDDGARPDRRCVRRP